MVSRFVKCSCGAVQARYKMQSVNNELMCRKCAKVEEAKYKRMARNADDYQVIVSLLDGTRLCYQRMEVSS